MRVGSWQVAVASLVCGSWSAVEKNRGREPQTRLRTLNCKPDCGLPTADCELSAEFSAREIVREHLIRARACPQPGERSGLAETDAVAESFSRKDESIARPLHAEER